MISRCRFILEESINGLKRGTLHSVVSVAAITIAVSLVGLFIYSIYNIQQTADGLLGSLEIQTFISLSIPDSEHQSLRGQIERIDSRWEVTYISRDDAAKEFAREFDPELFNVLRVNPLPASFRIKLPATSMQPDSANKIAQRLGSVTGIDDVIYDQQLLDLLHIGHRKLRTWGMFLTSLTIIVAVGITFNAIRLKIHAQREAMNLMSLLGANPDILYAIYWVQGAILGSIGGLLGFLIILGIAGMFRMRLLSEIAIFTPHLYLLIVAGASLGTIAGMVAVRKYLRV